MAIWKSLSLFSLFLALILIGCSSPATMRKLADKNKLDFGVAVKPGDMTSPEVQKLLKKNFNLLVAENIMKWQYTRPSKDFWNLNDIDSMVAFAQKNKMKVKWHTFIWHDQNPAYVSTLRNRDDAIALMTDYITTIMTRYKGKIADYEVANETLNDDGTMRNSIWYKVIGPDYLDIAFRIAHEADPEARLTINDYSNEYMGQTKADAFFALVKEMVERGVPIHGVGMQLHLINQPVDEVSLRANVKRFADLGLFVHFTEIDIRIANPVTPDKELVQQAAYLSLLQIALDEPNCRTFIVWGYSDKQSWIPRVFPGYGNAHLFDQTMQPKPVYLTLEKYMMDTKR